MGYLFTATFADPSQAHIQGLGDKRSGMAVVDQAEDRALVYTPHPSIRPLRTKIEQYADPTKVSEKTGLPRNASLIAPLESLRIASLLDLSDGWLRPDAIDEQEQIWVELWASGGRIASDEHRERVRRALVEFLELHELNGDIAGSFAATEHDIYLVKMSGVALMDLPVQLPEAFHLSPPERPIVPEVLERQTEMDVPVVREPSPDVGTVAVLDTGIAEQHPLLAPALVGPGASAVPGDNSAADSHGHGTRMAGVAVYRDLANDLMNDGPVEPRAWLQNVRIITGHDAPFPEFMLERTRDAVLEAEQQEANLRVFSMSLGARTSAPGGSTPWSVAVDQMAYNDGAGRLFCVPAGNQPLAALPEPHLYPSDNLSVGLTSPAEAVNAITVGAITDLDDLDDPAQGRSALASRGQLCPWSRCDVGGNRPIKPDVVTEGGNLSTDGTTCRQDAAMQLLTAAKDHAVGPWLTTTAATSAATASIAGQLSEIWQANQERRPETIRGLLVHSARWTDSMCAQMPNRVDRCRAFGYGKPQAAVASWSERPRPTLILEQMIRPERMIGTGREMHLLELPMPDAALRGLGDSLVEISVTLSYFIEPNEKRTMRYQAAGLRWALQRFSEDRADFRKRINRLEREPGERFETTAEDLPWELGPQARSRGSVQADRARVAASELTGDRVIAVWPVSGWWRDRDVDEDAAIRYALIITLDAGEIDVDLYTPILNEITIRTEI